MYRGTFTTGIFGNFYTKRGEGCLTSKTGIPGGPELTPGGRMQTAIDMKMFTRDERSIAGSQE